MSNLSSPQHNTTLTAPFCSRGISVAAAIVASVKPALAGTHTDASKF